MIDIQARVDEKETERELPAYRDGQVLRARDLRREDIYRHRAMREHQAQVHSAGIVCGLWLETGSSSVWLTPGMAIDGRGRSILVPLEEKLDGLDKCVPAGVWIAFKEWPSDGEDYQTPNAPPHRYERGFEILIREPGHCPEQPFDEVYLGLVGARESWSADGDRNQKGILNEGRRYVGAVGGRIESASGTSRILLGPEEPLDSRLFAIGTRYDADSPYTDHLTVEAGGILQLHSPSEMRLKAGQDETPASLQLGYRHLEFHPSDLPAPNQLADRLLNPPDEWVGELLPIDDESKAIVKKLIGHAPLSKCQCEAIARIVCRWLNPAIQFAEEVFKTDEDGGADATSKAKALQFFKGALEGRDHLNLRKETRFLLDERHWLRQPVLLMRLLLEDLFHPLLRQTDVESLEKWVLEFRGSKPTAESPRPNQLYLSRIETDEGAHEELRLEIQHPGKGNNPERFKAVVRTSKSIPPKPEDTPIPDPLPDFCLSVDASGTVTTTCLKVFLKGCAKESHIPKPKDKPCGFGHGLIRKIESGEKEKEAEALAEELSLIAPWDLAMSDIKLAKDDTESKFKLKLKLKNTGQAEMVGIQLHVLIFSTTSPEENPIRETVLRDLVLPAGEVANYELSPLEIPFGDSGIVDHNLKAHLMALGAGPGGTVAQEQRTVLVE